MRISDWSSDVCSSDLIAPQEIAHAIVEEPRRARPHPSLERESSIGRRIQISRGFKIEDTYAFDPVIIDTALQRPRVQALRHVSYQDGRGINAVGPDFHIVRHYLRPLDCAIAIQAYILQ